MPRLWLGHRLCAPEWNHRLPALWHQIPKGGLMARPQKQTVDYFPHDAYSGKTIFILQSRFGNNGYAVWFKTLALLCRTPGHAYYCAKPADWQFLLAEMALSEGETQTIFDCLAELEAIDPELWSRKIIFSQNLVNRLASVYRERKTLLPIKPPINPVIPPLNPDLCELSALETPQSKLKESKLKEIIVVPPLPPKPTTTTAATTRDNDFARVTKAYEGNIGLLTSITGDTLNDALSQFPAEWIIESITLAVKAEKRNWLYCEAILKRWKADGKNQLNIKRRQLDGKTGLQSDETPLSQAIGAAVKYEADQQQRKQRQR